MGREDREGGWYQQSVAYMQFCQVKTSKRAALQPMAAAHASLDRTFLLMGTFVRTTPHPSCACKGLSLKPLAPHLCCAQPGNLSSAPRHLSKT